MERIMTLAERRLCLTGSLLFLFGLVLGFAVPAFPDKQAVLNAHLTALGSGTFLIVIGLLWGKLGYSPKWSGVFTHMLWISFFVLEAGLTLAATSPHLAVDVPASVVQMISGALNAIGAILMVIAVTAVVVAMIRLKATADA
jgi:hypothetical protein